MPARIHKVWKDEDVATLRRLVAEGVPWYDIGRELERTGASVQRKAVALISGGPSNLVEQANLMLASTSKAWNNEDCGVLRRMADEGRGQLEIAKALDRTQADVYRQARRMDITVMSWGRPRDVARSQV